MQAIIMAAGKGSRLGNLTNDKPKAFLEIKGIKLIEYNIALLHHFGIKDIFIVTGYMCEAYEELEKRIDGIKCVFNPFFEMANVLGSFYIAQDKLGLTDTVYLHADTICDPNIMNRLLMAEGDIVLPIDYKQCDEEAMKVKIVGDKITEIDKGIDLAEGDGEFIGIAKLGKNSLDSIKKAAKEVLKEKRFNSYFEAAIQEVLDEGKLDVRPIPTDGDFWGEVDFLEDYQYAEKNIPESLVAIAKEEFG